MDEKTYSMLKYIPFLDKHDEVEQDYRGHSDALRFIVKNEKQKFFLKLYHGNIKNKLNEIYTNY